MPKYFSGDEYEQMKIKAEASGAIAQEIASSKKRSAMVPGAIGITIMVLVVATSIGVYSFQEITANFPGVSQTSEGGYEYTAPVDSEGNFVLQSEYAFSAFGGHVVESFTTFLQTIGNAMSTMRIIFDGVVQSYSPGTSDWGTDVAVPGSYAYILGETRMNQIYAEYQYAAKYYYPLHSGNMPIYGRWAKFYAGFAVWGEARRFIAYHVLTPAEILTLAEEYTGSTAGTDEDYDLCYRSQFDITFGFNHTLYHWILKRAEDYR